MYFTAVKFMLHSPVIIKIKGDSMSDFELGSEFEMLCHDTDEVIQQKIERNFGVSVINHNNDDSDDSYRHWVMKDDLSVLDVRGSRKGIEICTPVFDIDGGIAYIKDFLMFMKKNKYRTNHTTGLHVNLSFMDLPTREIVNPLKLICSLPEINILRMFNRLKNVHCRPYMYTLRRLVKTNVISKKLPIEVIADLFVRYLMDASKKHNRDPKNKCVNFLKLHTKHDYIEFRGIGNKDYETRWGDIRETILMYTHSMYESIDISNDDVYDKIRTLILR